MTGQAHQQSIRGCDELKIKIKIKKHSLVVTVAFDAEASVL